MGVVTDADVGDVEIAAPAFAFGVAIDFALAVGATIDFTATGPAPLGDGFVAAGAGGDEAAIKTGVALTLTFGGGSSAAAGIGGAETSETDGRATESGVAAVFVAVATSLFLGTTAVGGMSVLGGGVGTRSTDGPAVSSPRCAVSASESKSFHGCQ